MDRIEMARQKHLSGYNCAQAVACAYCDLFGIAEADMFRLSEGLGLGMGSMAGTCGALAGACLLAGLKNSTANLAHPDSKRSTYALAAALTEQFQKASGAVRCRDLKGIDTGRMLCPCNQCVENACRAVEAVLLADRQK